MDKTLLKIVLVFAFFLFILIFVASSYKRKQKKEFFKADTYKGVISEKYNQEHNHGNPVIDIIEKNDTLGISVINWPNIWEYSEIGDSVYKPADKLILILNKKNGDQYILQYYNGANNTIIYVWVFIFLGIILINISKPGKGKMNKTST